MSEKRDLAADLKICEEALPGPWDVKPNGQRCYQVVDHGVYVIADWLSVKNAEFISIAREALPYWLKRVQELEAENARLREDMDFLKQEYRDSEEPMTDDAIELQARLKILQERDELRAENRRLRSVLSDIMCKRAANIMEFHAFRCPLNPFTNFSGSEEHLAEYRQVIKEIKEKIG